MGEVSRIGHEYLLAVARKFRYPGSPVFPAGKTWLRLSIRHASKAVCLLISAHTTKSPAFMPDFLLYVRDGRIGVSSHQYFVSIRTKYCVAPARTRPQLLHFITELASRPPSFDSPIPQ